MQTSRSNDVESAATHAFNEAVAKASSSLQVRDNAGPAMWVSDTQEVLTSTMVNCHCNQFVSLRCYTRLAKDCMLSICKFEYASTTEIYRAEMVLSDDDGDLTTWVGDARSVSPG
jgi:hypothetical protein